MERFELNFNKMQLTDPFSVITPHKVNLKGGDFNTTHNVRVQSTLYKQEDIIKHS